LLDSRTLVSRGVRQIAALTAAIIMLSSFAILTRPAQAEDAVKANYVGVQACAGCHQAEAERWKTSHHAFAMEKATPETVLGDFSGVSIENFGVVSTFSRVGGKILVRTDVPMEHCTTTRSPILSAWIHCSNI
jgi:hypothetical protein